MVKNLSIIYENDFEIDSKLDGQIEAALQPLGFERWASGMDMTNGKRDLAFERKDNHPK